MLPCKMLYGFCTRTGPIHRVLLWNRTTLRSRSKLSGDKSRLRERLPMQMHCVMDCSSEKGHQTGLLYCPWMSWDSAYTRVHSVILCAYCVCGKRQTVEHALSCSHGGFPALRHSDITARCISEVCHNVAVEPELQPWGETAAEDSILRRRCTHGRKCTRFFGREASACIFDVRVFTSYAPSNCKSTQAAVYSRHENEKRRSYQQ